MGSGLGSWMLPSSEASGRDPSLCPSSPCRARPLMSPCTFSSLTSAASCTGGAMDGGEDLSPDRLEKSPVKHQTAATVQLPSHPWKSPGAQSQPRQEHSTEREKPVLLEQFYFKSGPTKVPCLSFLISEMGKTILTSSPIQRNNY